jgi:Thiamine pyrophosphate enzyme, central domain
VPEQLPRVLEIAMRTVLQRGGVAVIAIPGEVFFADAPSGAVVSPVRATTSVVRPSEGSLAAAAQVLNAAERVTILAGAGRAGAHDQLIALAAALQAPVVHALRGKEFVEHDNRFDVGMTGLIGFSSGYRAMEHCDALLLLGTDFPYRQFYPDGVPVLQVDVRGEQIGRRVPVDVALVGTVKDTIDALLPLITVKADAAHPGPDGRALPAGPRPAGPAGRRRPGSLAASPAVRRRHDRPAGRHRRGLHRRCRHALHLGRPLPADERQAQADRLLHARVHGQRTAPGHRRAGKPARPAGRRPVRRRRARDAAG